LEQVGTVKAIYRYPVKSMAGESLRSATVGASGLAGDRRYVIHRLSDQVQFPVLTARELSALVTWRAHYRDASDLQHPVRISSPEGDWDITDPALGEHLTRAAQEEVAMAGVDVGLFDTMPVSVLSTATVAMVEAKVGRPIDERRFRANIVVESTASGESGRETNWLGGTLVFGQRTKVRAEMPIERCVMITIDPDSAQRDPAILRCVVQEFANHIGVCCATETEGSIAVGDPVFWDRGPLARS